MKFKSYLIHGSIAIVCIVLLMISRGFFTETEIEGKVLVAADSFTAIGLLFTGFGLLIWISSTGVFDMLGYAMKKGAHALIPGLVKFEAEDFYEYKMVLKDKKKNASYNAILRVGLIVLAIAVVLVVVWYKVSGNL